MTNVDNNIYLDEAGGWWFSDETEDLHGPYASRIVAMMQLRRYFVWLEYGEIELAQIENTPINWN